MVVTAQAQKETLGFQTEVKQLLKLMIHSLYSNKEIFLRELISNASDACDKLRFEGLKDESLYENNSELSIHVSVDKKERTITIRDNGIGMNRDEVIENIGTIAKSGTRQFFEALSGDQAKDAELIGQFGVGFYSAFIIADKVTLRTRRAGMGDEHGVEWESAGEGDYTLQTITKADRGTEVILHLRDGEDEFLENYRISSIIRRYSDHISLPITMPKEGDEDAVDTINQASALWKRAKADVTEEEYNEFYKHVSHDFEEPLAHVHTHVEGNQSYSSLFYIPKRAPFDLWDREQRRGIKLYVKRVFIMEESEQLMPSYLRFVRGLVDSDDLPLNVSREILQRNRHIDAVRGASVKKVLGLLESLAQNSAEKYTNFWKEFGNVLKEGPAEDSANRERIAKLLRFASTQNENSEQTVSLSDYVSRMKEGQEKIYFITADSFAAAKNSPHLEIFRKKGLEVLLMSDRVDEWLMSYLTEFDGKQFQSVTKGDLDLGKLEDENEKAEREQQEKQAEGVIKRIKEALSGKVKEVRVTHRLTNSPACLVVEEEEMAANLQRILKSAGHEVPVSLPIMEVNPAHPLIQRLENLESGSQFNDWAEILFDQSILAEGGQLEDPATFVSRLNDLLVSIKA